MPFDNRSVLAERIDALLPQTQCQKCGYAGCRPYAEAIANNQADFNQCPPGGAETIAALAEFLDRDLKPLNPSNGVERVPSVAVIDEPACIGCARCIQVCPVDAILGAAKYMHTVIAQECTGCELCLVPCPVDCIVMQPITPLARQAKRSKANSARRRYQARQQRLTRAATERAAKLHAKKAALNPAKLSKTAKQAIITAALERAKAKKAAHNRQRYDAEND